MSSEIAAECVAFERTPHSFFFFAYLSLFRYFWSRTKTLKKQPPYTKGDYCG